jgi:benzoyl-CoA 2,3-dioxygenase component B
MNEVLREEYIRENLKSIDYWNRECERAELAFRFVLPHRRFNRTVGEYAGHHFDPEGNAIDDATWNRRRDEWMPTQVDKAYVKSLMQVVTEPGTFAGWIAPPLRGIDGQPLEYEYVKL